MHVKRVLVLIAVLGTIVHPYMDGLRRTREARRIVHYLRGEFH